MNCEVITNTDVRGIALQPVFGQKVRVIGSFQIGTGDGNEGEWGVRPRWLQKSTDCGLWLQPDTAEEVAESWIGADWSEPGIRFEIYGRVGEC